MPRNLGAEKEQILGFGDASGTTGPRDAGLRRSSSATASIPPTTPSASIASDSEDGETTELPALNFSFACGGWMQLYLFGSAQALMDHGLHRVSPSQQFVGASAGALAATALAFESDLFKVKEYCVERAIPEAHGTWGGPFRITKYIAEALHYASNITDEKVAALAPGRFQVAVTEVLPRLRGRRFSEFSDSDDVIQTLLASGAAVPFAQAIKLNGRWSIDGGLTNFQPRLPESAGETVYVNPLYFSRADIRPSRYVPLWWVVLPPNDPGAIDWLFELGYRDALAWMERRGLSHCCNHRNAADDATAAAAAAKDGASHGGCGGSRGYETNGCKGSGSGGGSSIMDCTMRPRRKLHALDHLEQHSFRRLVGYGAGNAALDAATVLCMLLLWKPVSFLLIYVELAGGAAWLALHTAATAMAPASPLLLAAALLLLPPVLPLSAAPAVLGMAIVTSALVLLAGGSSGCGRAAAERRRRLAEHFALIFSASLFMRMLPVLGSKVVIRKHHRLLEQSFVYRMAAHII